MFIIVGLVNKLQMRQYLSVCFCGHFSSIDPLSNRAKIDNVDHVKYYKKSCTKHSQNETTVLKKWETSVESASDRLF